MSKIKIKNLSVYKEYFKSVVGHQNIFGSLQPLCLMMDSEFTLRVSTLDLGSYFQHINVFLVWNSSDLDED